MEFFDVNRRLLPTVSLTYFSSSSIANRLISSVSVDWQYIDVRGHSLSSLVKYPPIVQVTIKFIELLYDKQTVTFCRKVEHISCKTALVIPNCPYQHFHRWELRLVGGTNLTFDGRHFAPLILLLVYCKALLKYYKQTSWATHSIYISSRIENPFSLR